MAMLEQVPDRWDRDRDERFFRITARLLPPAFVAAASALLASYDEEPAPAPVAAPAARLPRQTAVPTA